MSPTLLTLARRALTGEAAVAPGSTVLVAVSGGPDSMVLLHVLARLLPALRIALHAHGVDHGLREEAAGELDGAERFAASLGVAFTRTRLAMAPGGNLQARARTARYGALASAAATVGARTIATAHHADDRAETVLLRLMRGAGPRGLAILPARAPLQVGAPAGSTIELIRPLVRARRSDVHAHASRHGIAFARDPSNEDPRFLRARVRSEVVPLLESLAPGIVGHLVALADQLAEGQEPGPSLVLSRATRTALTLLARSRSTTARVWLPGGLVVSFDPRARPDVGPSSET